MSPRSLRTVPSDSPNLQHNWLIIFEEFLHELNLKFQTKVVGAIATILFSAVIFFFRKLWYAKVFGNNIYVYPKELLNIVIAHLASQSFHCGIINSITVKSRLD